MPKNSNITIWSCGLVLAVEAGVGEGLYQGLPIPKLKLL